MGVFGGWMDGQAVFVAIVIVGAGALGRETLAALWAAGQKVAGFLVEPGHAASPVHGVVVRDDPGAWITEAETRFVVAIGDGRARSRLVGQLGRVRYATVVHPAATLGPNVRLAEGVIILGPASLTVDVELGSHVLVNPGCTLAHDCVVGAFANFGPSVSLAGGVVVEEGANLGVGAVVAPGCRIGAWAVVGAGAVVIRDVQPGSTVVGVPARPLGKHGRPSPD